jgi:hypothetical protein
MRIRKASLRAYVRGLRLSVGMSILAGPAWTQEISKLDRERANDMLKVIGEDVRKTITIRRSPGSTGTQRLRHPNRRSTTPLR